MTIMLDPVEAPPETPTPKNGLGRAALIAVGIAGALVLGGIIATSGSSTISNPNVRPADAPVTTSTLPDVAPTDPTATVTPPQAPALVGGDSAPAQAPKIAPKIVPTPTTLCVPDPQGHTDHCHPGT